MEKDGFISFPHKRRSPTVKEERGTGTMVEYRYSCPMALLLYKYKNSL